MKALVLSGGAAHGAYQAGAIQALEECGWSPDLVCGTSVGAINGAALASQMPADELVRIWKDVTNDDVYRWRPMSDWLRFWTWNHLLDTKPLQGFLEDVLDLTVLRQSPVHFVCFGVLIETMCLVAWANRSDGPVEELGRRYEVRPVDVPAILGSAAIPLVFPWVEGIWDGSILQHTPVKPAVWMGADEIVVVNLDRRSDGMPEGPVQAVLQLVDIASGSRLPYDLGRIRERNQREGYRKVQVDLVQPDRPIPYSKMDFGSPEMDDVIRRGYEDTMNQMEDQ